MDGKLFRSLRLRRDVLAQLRLSAVARDPSRPLIWLHAPSVGEGLQARPILEALRAAHPEWQLAYTYFSPSAERFANALDVDLVSVLPFDGEREANAMLELWQPTVLAFVKLDVWPVLATTAANRGVRTALVSATMAPNSSRSSVLARAILGDAYASLNAIGAISGEDGERLARLGVRHDRVTVTGDTRMDQVWDRAQAVRSELESPTISDGFARTLSALRSSAPTLICGSTWPADDAILLPAISAWLRANPLARVVIAPHEPAVAALQPLSSWANQSHLPAVTLSDVEATPSRPWRVLLVDRVGVLGALYALGTVAYVGGGFHRAGLHSVLEPAAYSMPVLFGPRHANAREAGVLLTRGGAFTIASSSELAERLAALSSNDALRTTMGGNAEAVVQEGRGATNRVVALLEQLVRSASDAARPASR